MYSDEINALINKCEDFINSLFIFEHNYINFCPNDHKGCFIDYLDSSCLVSQKDNFLKNLLSSISDYVYTGKQQSDRLFSSSGSNSHKYNRLLFDAKETFRKQRFIIPTSITKKQYENELSNYLKNMNDIDLFNKLYTLNTKETFYNLNNYSIQEAKQLILVFEKYKFDYKTIILQGQFSELLLYNILINFYEAVPLVHKMPITTNPNLERHGIDAIHVGIGEKNPDLFIGESKAYNRVQGSFKAAILDSINDIILHHDNLTSELNLYNFSDNVSDGLENYLKDFLKGKHKDTKINLVCMITYNSEQNIVFNNRESFINKTKELIKKDCEALDEKEFIDKFHKKYLDKIIFVLFPLKEMKELIFQFQKELGK